MSRMKQLKCKKSALKTKTKTFPFQCTTSTQRITHQPEINRKMECLCA